MRPHERSRAARAIAAVESFCSERAGRWHLRASHSKVWSSRCGSRQTISFSRLHHLTHLIAAHGRPGSTTSPSRPLSGCDFMNLAKFSVEWRPADTSPLSYQSALPMAAAAFWNAMNCILYLNKLPKLTHLAVAAWMVSPTVFLSFAALLRTARLPELQELSLRITTLDPLDALQEGPRRFLRDCLRCTLLLCETCAQSVR